MQTKKRTKKRKPRFKKLNRRNIKKKPTKKSKSNFIKKYEKKKANSARQRDGVERERRWGVLEGGKLYRYLHGLKSVKTQKNQRDRERAGVFFFVKNNSETKNKNYRRAKGGFLPLHMEKDRGGRGEEKRECSSSLFKTERAACSVALVSDKMRKGGSLICTFE